MTFSPWYDLNFVAEWPHKGAWGGWEAAPDQPEAYVLPGGGPIGRGD